MSPCDLIYTAALEEGYGLIPRAGVAGRCRVTGQEGEGLAFRDWVKDTFTNHDALHPGEIISWPALFCFDEQSEFLRAKTGRDKPQRMRTYSHIIDRHGQWHCCTKADKAKILALLLDSPRLVSLTDSGQKHLLFKNRPPFWQLDDTHILPSASLLTYLHGQMMQLLELGFSQTEVRSGVYRAERILKAGRLNWSVLEDSIKPHRRQPMFDLAAWLMYIIKSE